MKAFICCLLILDCLSAFVLANIGETQEQVEKRYGKPVYITDKLFSQCVVCVYDHDKYKTRVIFFNGTSQEEDFTKADYKSSITTEEANDILKAHANNGTWKLENSFSNDTTRWSLDNPASLALLTTAGGISYMKIEGRGFGEKFVKLISEKAPASTP